MIVILVLTSWIVALTVVTGLCAAAGRGDAALRCQLLETRREQLLASALDVATAAATGEGRASGTPRRQAEHEHARVGRVAVG